MMMSSPEPMSLGSPTQSPSAGSSSNNQYLPQFLLGDMPNQPTSNTRTNLMQSHYQHHQQQVPTGTNGRYWTGANNSPTRMTNMLNPNQMNSMMMSQHSGGSGAGPSGSSLGRSYSISAYDAKSNMNLLDKNQETSYHHHNHHIYGANNYGSSFGNQTNFSPHHERSINASSLGTDRTSAQQQQIPGAPPVNRLVDMLNKPTFSPSGAGNPLTPTDTLRSKYSNNDLFGSAGEHNLHHQNSSNRISPPSPAQIDPFYNYGDSIRTDEKLDEAWITIFGFPPSAASYVLQEFAVYGQIVRHVSTTQGNWIHIQYQTKLQAQKALSKSGKVLANQLMVGVMPCIDKKLMDSYGSKNSDMAAPTSPTSLTSSSSNSKLATSMSTTKIGMTRLDRTQSLRTNVRPLGPYNRSNLDGLPSAKDNSSQAKLPKKNNNVISKAMEFMFGW